MHELTCVKIERPAGEEKAKMRRFELDNDSETEKAKIKLLRQLDDANHFLPKREGGWR